MLNNLITSLYVALCENGYLIGQVVFLLTINCVGG